MEIILLILAVIGIIALFNVVGGIINLIIMVAVWAFIGWAASRLMGGDGMGIIGNVLMGLVGGIFGRLLLGLLGMQFGDGIFGQLIVGVIGSVVLIALVRMVRNNPNFGK